MAAQHPGYKDFVWAVEVNRFSMNLIGVWPKVEEEVEDTFASDLRLSIVLVILNFLFFVPAAWSFIRIRGNMVLMIDNLQITLSLLIFTLKLVIMRWKHTAILLQSAITNKSHINVIAIAYQMKNVSTIFFSGNVLTNIVIEYKKSVSSIVKMMLEDWIKLKPDSERSVMLRRARTARLFAMGGYVVIAGGFMMMIVLPSFGLPCRHVTNITDRNRPLPLQAYYFYDTDKSPQFELTFIVQALTVFLSTVVYTSVDSFLGLAILHICGQLENFKERLFNLVACKNFDRTLRKYVETHRRLIRFANNIEDAFSLLLLGLVFHFGIVFCLCTFIFLTAFTEHGNLALSRIGIGIIGTIVLFTHAFLYCGAGEIITEQCEAVNRALYDIDWYKLEPKKTRSLMLLMMRAKEPLRITAGKIIPLTMMTFCSLLKTSVGYMSVLLAMGN